MKSLFAFIISLVLIFALCSFASADTILIAGNWSLVTEDGSIWEISSYIGEEKDVATITEYGTITLTTLGNHALANNETTERVSVLSPISRIGDYAFLNATGIISVLMTPSVDSIGIGAFSGTVSLREVNIQDTSITAASPFLFMNSGIEEIVLPETCSMISHDAFSGCGNLAKITIPSSVTEIGEDAFIGCTNLVIHAPKDSYAIEYAIAHDIPYQFTDYTEVTFVIGDADGDGSVTIMDATRIQRVLAILDADEDGMIALRGDMNADDLDIMDATRIQRKLALYDDPYHIGDEITVKILADGTVVRPTSAE